MHRLAVIHASLELFSNKASELTLMADEVTLITENEAMTDYYEFGVVNFEFSGNHNATKIIQNGPEPIEHSYLNLEMKAPWGIATADPLPNHNEIIKRIKAQKSTSITCKFIVKSSRGIEADEIINNLDELCRLLSLSRATKITWINAVGYTATGKIKDIILKNSITWPFSSGDLIDSRDHTDTAVFIEKAYPAYLRLRKEYNLDIAIEQYLDANNSTTYLETRGLAAVALIDSLQQLYTSKHRLTKIIKGFGNKKEDIKAALTSTISTAFPNIESQQLSDILEKLPELNRKPFFSLLRAWTNSIGLNIADSELRKIVRTRNSLAHNMSYRSRDSRGKQVEYFRLINFVNQVFLKLLSYDGHFIYVDLNDLSFNRKQI
jgi:hypothetical protein